MSWQDIGSVDVGPRDREVLVGPFLMEEGDDTIWVHITQTSPGNEKWNFSYGLLSWRTVQGHELGTVKVYGDTEGGTYKLSVGLPPSERYGDLIFEPRPYNSRWINIEDPPIWGLSFKAQSGKVLAGSGSDVPVFGTGATLGVLGDVADAGLRWVIRNGVAYLLSTANK